jgi:hypothetical protein
MRLPETHRPLRADTRQSNSRRGPFAGPEAVLAYLGRYTPGGDRRRKMAEFFVWRVFHPTVEHLLLRLGMRQQLGARTASKKPAAGKAGNVVDLMAVLKKSLQGGLPQRS